MVPEGRRVFADLTVLENLKIGAYLRNDKSGIEQDIEWIYSLFPRLKERSWQLAGHALRRRAADAGRGPRADEPAEAADDGRAVAGSCAAGGAGHLRYHPGPSTSQGVTVLLIEQNANMALKLADRAYVLETGLITKTGTGAELLADESIKEAYLGKKKAH